MNTVFEENKLKSVVGKRLLQKLEKHNMILAGGTITSIFTNSEINDLDVYARNQDDAISFIEDCWGEGYLHIVSSTNKALQFIYGDKAVQVIYFNFFENAEAIFETFDFTVNMGAYDFKEKKFVFHEDFLKHNAQRILKFNSNTSYPMVSALRVQKYENKGYKISKPEYLRIVMACMNLEINSYEDLQEHLGGMYGVNMDRLFDEFKDEEFDMSKAIEKIGNITYSEEYFAKPTVLEFKDLNDLLIKIKKDLFKIFEFKNKKYRYFEHSDIVEQHDGSTKDIVETTLDEVVNFEKLYKFVRKDSEGNLSSWYRNKFKYKIGEVADAKNSDDKYNVNKLFFVKKNHLDSSHLHNNKDVVLIEVTFDKEDIIDFEDWEVHLSKCKVERIVPEDEWVKWIKK